MNAVRLKNRRSFYCKIIALILFCLVVALFACSCKVTDFFTEVIIIPNSTVVDTDNQDRTIINSPNAVRESSVLAALKWTDNSTRLEEIQNLVTWSNEPNSIMSTHRSLYDTVPLFPGIKASDGVRLVYNLNASLDHEVDSIDQQSNDTMSSKGTGGEVTDTATGTLRYNFSENTDGGGQGVLITENNGSENENSDSNGNSGADTSPNPDTYGASSGGSENGTDSGSGSSENPSDEPGETVDKYAGYGGGIPYYSGNDLSKKPPKANQVGVIGKQAAVLVQSIGGAGAICAMGKNTYYNRDVNTCASFGDIFGSSGNNECPASDALFCWTTEESGALLGDLNVEALVNTAGENGVIYYDQTLVTTSQTSDGYAKFSCFTEDQQKELWLHNITFVPIDMSTADGMYQGASAIGYTLSNSSTIKQSSTEYANKYIDALKNITNGTMNVHGGGWAYYGTSQPTLPGTAWSGFENISKGTTLTATLVTDAKTGLASNTTYTMFSYANQSDKSPLEFWMSTAGVCNQTNYSDGMLYDRGSLVLLWPQHSSSFPVPSTNYGARYYSDMVFGAIGDSNGGLGSKNQPYLIVADNKDGTISASQIKQATSNEIMSKNANALYAAYNGDPATYTTIGHKSTEEGEDTNAFLTGLNASDVVKINPYGLLGSWTQPTYESLLEQVWLANLYCSSVSGCSYNPSDFGFSLDKFNISVPTAEGTKTCTSCEEIIETFYSTFYRYDLGSTGIVSYDNVVIDNK